MRDWTPERIRAEAAAWVWVWVPEGARQHLTEDYHLVAYPEAFVVPTQVAWCRSDRPAPELVDEVVGRVRAWGRPDVSFWVGEDTRPPDLTDHLRTHGAEHVESVEVLALELDDVASTLSGEPQSGRVTVRRVVDEATLHDADLVSGDVWGHAERPEDEVADQLAALTAEDAEELRVVGYVDGEPACSGGCALAGDVARMWGGATRPAYRRTGAYRAVLAERIRLAQERGATLALVRGITDTSAPILRGLGFTGHGLQHRYRLSV